MSTEQPASKRPAWRRWLFPDRKTGGWKSQVYWLVTRVLLWYLVIVVIISLLQRKLIYHPSRADRLPASEVIPAGCAHDIEIETHDGLTLHGWHFLPNDKTLADRAACDAHLAKAKQVVLFFHGNAGHRAGRREMCRAFTANGADVFLFDYRGYGENPGTPNETDIIADARAMWDYMVKERGIPPGKIVIFGGSLGGGVAVQLAADVCRNGETPGGLVLWATFSSLTDAGKTHYPWLPVGWVLRDRYESITHAGDVTCPVLQLHGDVDRIVPFELGRKLHAAFPDSSAHGVAKRFVELTGVGHNNLPLERLRTVFGEFVGAIREEGDSPRSKQ